MANQSSNKNSTDDVDDDRLPEGTDGTKGDSEVLDLDELLEQSERIQAEQDTHDDNE